MLANLAILSDGESDIIPVHVCMCMCRCLSGPGPAVLYWDVHVGMHGD